MNITEPVIQYFKEITLEKVLYTVFPVVFIALLYGSFFPLNGGFFGEYHDIFANSFYYKVVFQDILPQWNNLYAGGFPLIASPHSDIYYPLSVPFYFITGSLSIVNILLLFHLFIAYLAMHKLGSLITKNECALLLFSLFYTFSAVTLGRIYAGHHLLLYGLAWIPLLYYYFLKITVYSESNVKNAIFFTMVSCLVYFTGDIYHFVLVYSLMAILFLALAAKRQLTRKMTFLLGLSVVLTALIIAISILPVISVSGEIVRNDPIDPLDGGGSFENVFSSFVFGNGIDTTFATYESAVLVGIIPVLLLIIALIFGKREITIPSFFALLYAILWSAAGNTLLSFIHLLPILNTFRCPGRIFGVLLPLVLFLALYGAILLFDKIRLKEGFALTQEQKRMILVGVGICIVVKALELPFQHAISFEAGVAVLMATGFIALLYMQKGTLKNIGIFFTISLVAEAIIISSRCVPGLTSAALIKLALIGIIFIGLFLIIRKTRKMEKNPQIFCAIIIVAVFIMMVGTMSYVTTYNPALDKSPAKNVILEIQNRTSSNSQVWVLETGWPFQHMDFTYWDIMNNIHPMRLYQAYYLDTIPQVMYSIGNVTYYTPDFIVDTQYLENGKVSLQNQSFIVDNIPVYVPEHVLPNAFLIRNTSVIPLNISTFRSGVVAASGNILPGDILVLKAAYYPGWTVNGEPARNLGNMIASEAKASESMVVFRFEPVNYKIGVIISCFGVLLLVLVFLKRKEIEAFFNVPTPEKGIKNRKLKK